MAKVVISMAINVYNENGAKIDEVNVNQRIPISVAVMMIVAFNDIIWPLLMTSAEASVSVWPIVTK